jgi:hypothetical protein
MTLEFAAGVSCKRAVGHHLQTPECESQTVLGVVRFGADVGGPLKGGLGGSGAIAEAEPRRFGILEPLK